MLKAWTGTLCCTLLYGMYYRATWMGHHNLLFGKQSQASENTSEKQFENPLLR